MTEIEKKALALLNTVARARGGTDAWPHEFSRINCWESEALCRAIERHEAAKAEHEAYKQDVSDAVEDLLSGSVFYQAADVRLRRFIIPKPVDPLVEAWIEATGNTVGMEPLNAALAKRGLKIVEDV